MWLSKQMRPAPPTADADMGMTTIGGEQTGVVTRGEVRDLPVYGPGGYVWLPENGKAVLVIKGGPGGEEQCVAGTAQEAVPEGLEPGEVCLFSGSGAVILSKDGSIVLRGTVKVEGDLLINGEPWAQARGEGG